MKKDIYLIAAKRTPVGKFGGSLSKTSATQLGAIIINELLKTYPSFRDHIDEVILGNTLSSGLGQNPARIAAISANLPQSTPSFTVNKVCGSGLKSVALAAQSILTEDANLVIAGGMENMSLCPYIINNYRFGSKMGDQVIKDAMIFDGLFCSLIGEHMGMTAEYVAEKYKISRKDQEEYAVESHKRAMHAVTSGIFKKEIVPIPITQGKKEAIFDTDEQPRSDTNLEILSKLIPVFKKNGSVTAATASPINDGAAGVLVASEKFIKKHNTTPMAKIVSFASVGIDPKYMGMGSYYAAEKCLINAGLKVSDIDIWELNEAFASQSIAVIKLLGVDPSKVNTNGGAIALGHPIGASGTRILTTLIYELKRQKKQYGVASLCIGGGQGIAMLIENI